jgi:hypothetical protein
MLSARAADSGAANRYSNIIAADLQGGSFHCILPELQLRPLGQRAQRLLCELHTGYRLLLMNR